MLDQYFYSEPAAMFVQQGVILYTDLSKFDYVEFDKYMLKEEVYSFEDKMRAPYSNFLFSFGDTPLVIDEGVLVHTIGVLRMSKFIDMFTKVVGTCPTTTGDVDNTYIIMFWYSDNGAFTRGSVIVEPGANTNLLNVEFGHEKGIQDDMSRIVTHHVAYAVHYICKKMSVVSRWWGDTAKAMKKVNRPSKKKPSNYVGTLSIFIPGSRPNPENKGKFKKGSYQRTVEEILVRGGFVRTYWILPENAEPYCKKWEDAGREVAVFPNEPDEKGKIPMILVMKGYKINPNKEGEKRHVRQIR